MATYVFFDIFDTLVHADRGLLDRFISRELDRKGDKGLVDTKEAVIEMFKDRQDIIDIFIDNIPMLQGKDRAEATDMCYDGMAAYYDSLMCKSICVVEPAVLHSLQHLKQNGCQLCIISDASKTDIAHWSESPLSQYFDNHAFSCDVGYEKPSPELFDAAIKAMGCDPQKDLCIYVGDGGHDELMAAKRAGFQTIKIEHFKDRDDRSILDYTDIAAPTHDDISQIIDIMIEHKERTGQNIDFKKIADRAFVNQFFENNAKEKVFEREKESDIMAVIRIDPNDPIVDEVIEILQKGLNTKLTS